MKMRQNGNVCKVVRESPLRMGVWRAVDAGEDWDVFKRKFPDRLGPCFSKFVLRPSALSSLGSFLEMQTVRPTPDPLNQNLHFNKMPRRFVTYNIETPCSKTHLASQNVQVCHYLFSQISALVK